MGLPFFVGPGALIPRQDTETLCETALTWLKTRPDARVLDLCCGTGCIGVSLSKLGGARAAFGDISPEALALARRNAARNGVDVCFEGVEDQEMVDYLKGYGDVLLQGYYFDKPLLPDDFMAKYGEYMKNCRVIRR